MDDEKKTVGLSPAGNRAVEVLTDTVWFGEGIDAFRVAVGVAVALGKRTEPNQMGKTKTKYNVGSIDAGGKMAKMVRVFYPRDSQDGVYPIVEELADAGLKVMAERVEEGGAVGEIVKAAYSRGGDGGK